MRYSHLILLLTICSCAGSAFCKMVETGISASHLHDEQPEARSYNRTLIAPLIGLPIVFLVRDINLYIEPVFGIGAGLKIPASSDVTFDVGFRWHRSDWGRDLSEEWDIFGPVLGISIWF